jgi:myo-inositol 2-dehydrogenase/D-chiro-inositol 1-dehydrogenase
VVIASPTDTHCDVAMAASAAGKAIYCEKPIGLSLERSQAAVNAITKAGVPVMMGFNRRFEPAYSAIRDAIGSGEIGRLQIVQMTSRGPQNPPTPEYVKSSGGFFRDKGVHFFDLLRFVTDDEPVEISTMGAVITDPFIGEAGDYDTLSQRCACAAARLHDRQHPPGLLRL